MNNRLTSLPDRDWQAVLDVVAERDRQDAKWGEQNHNPPVWLAILTEEVGELATALNGDDRANMEEEFADVLAGLCTLANINDVELAQALVKKYLSAKPPEGPK